MIGGGYWNGTPNKEVAGRPLATADIFYLVTALLPPLELSRAQTRKSEKP
jgi:hypothetical protein